MSGVGMISTFLLMFFWFESKKTHRKRKRNTSCLPLKVLLAKFSAKGLPSKSTWSLRWSINVRDAHPAILAPNPPDPFWPSSMGFKEYYPLPKMNECPWKRSSLKGYVIFQPSIFRGHVSFQRGKVLCKKKHYHSSQPEGGSEKKKKTCGMLGC